MPNALATERSLYLRQHAHNPVPWQPWSDEVFERAGREDKLVFLSIGYSSCHWCHVMEHESFADDQVAAILDRWYVPVKVDREERPDIDAVYMSVCQAMTGHGGWPLTVVLTPDKEVVFVGTYFPKRSTPYRIGLIELLERIAELWQTDRERLVSNAREVMRRIADHLRSADRGHITFETCRHAAETFRRAFDPEYGGFGHQPKFPMPAALWFLLAWSQASGDADVRRMVFRTLEAMRWGGLWDHVGGGFHRYSTDRRWFLPHFEKMLYDQALLLLVYAESAALGGNELFRRTAWDIARYLDAEMALDCGAFAASEDADTAEGEGAFYQWRYEELAALLGPDDLDRLAVAFSVHPDGNAHDEATGKPTGRNILFAGSGTNDVLQRLGGVSLDEFFAWWEPIRQQLYAARAKRQRPMRDDKVLCDWNALAALALARAGRVFGERWFVERAERVWAYLDRAHRQPSGLLAHCSYDGEPTQLATLDDQATAAWAAIELYQATGTRSYFDRARELLSLVERHFVGADGVLVNVPSADVLPVTEAADGATVAAVGAIAWTAAALGFFDGGEHFRQSAMRIFERYGGTVSSDPASHSTMLAAWLLAEHGRIIEFRAAARDRQRLHAIVQRTCNPLALVTIETVADGMPPQATICTATECTPPIVGWDEIERALTNVPQTNHQRTDVQ